MGRPRIEGLRSLNARLLETQVDALDRVVETERVKRNDPSFTRTTALREAVTEYVVLHATKRRPR